MFRGIWVHFKNQKQTKFVKKNQDMKIDEKRILFTLTVEEFVELSKTITAAYSSFTRKEEPKAENESDIIFINDVTILTGYKPSTVYSKVCRGEIPTISNGRPLTFSKEEIVQWMKSGRPSVAETKSKQFLSYFNKKG